MSAYPEIAADFRLWLNPAERLALVRLAKKEKLGGNNFLLIKQKVKHIRENPYLQYFTGMKEYGTCPLGTSKLVVFQKRFSEKDLAAILEASVPKA